MNNHFGHEDTAPSKSSVLVRRLWKELLKTGIFLLATGIVLVFGSIAWFVSNNRTQATTASVSAKHDPIRLATKGKRQTAETDYLRIQVDSTQPNGTTLPDGETYPFETETYYYTESGTIALRLSEDNIVVSPGASGTATFYILPTRDGAMSLTLYVGLAGYAVKQNNTPAERIDDKTLDALLSGHILLFRNKDENGHYSGWLGEDNTITVSLPATAKKDIPQAVTLYWIWPLRYENMVGDLYETGSAEYRDSFAPFIEKQSNYDKMTNITENYRYSRIFLTNAAVETDEACSKAYNLADEYIGTNAQYLYLAIQTSAVRGDTN